MAHSREEVEAAVDKYIAVRDQICAGNGTWRGLAQFFTDDAVFIDPAWGRVEGIEAMKETVFGEAMVGLEDWSFPTEFSMIDGDNVVIKWFQVLPGRRENGSRYTQSRVWECRPSIPTATSRGPNGRSADRWPISRKTRSTTSPSAGWGPRTPTR
jgi:hypothetical protein